MKLARDMRSRATPAESLAWEFLRDRRFLGLKFRRQHQIGDYIVDFYCDEMKFAIELDGPVHTTSERQRIDHKRDAYLQSLGLTIHRIRNEELIQHTEVILQQLALLLNPSHSGMYSSERWGTGFRDHRGEILFIDARKMGRMVDRTHRELTDEDIAHIAKTYHAWRGENVDPSHDSSVKKLTLPDYQDIPGFCKSATLEEIRKHGHVLTPGRYVGAAAVEDDGEPFEEKMKRLTATLREQMDQSATLEKTIWTNLKDLGFGD